MKKLTKILLATALVCGLIAISAKRNYAQSTQDRKVSSFTGIGVAGSFDVLITQGSVESVKVEAPDDMIDRVITEVVDGELKIYNKRDDFNWNGWFRSHKKITVYVTVKTLHSIGLSGSGDVVFREGISTNGTMKIRVSGSGDITGKLMAQSLELSISGSGDVKLEGKVDESSVHISGSGDFSGRDLVTESTTIHVSGSGDASINANSKVEASVSGSGDITYTGKASQVSTAKSGSGSIHRS